MAVYGKFTEKAQKALALSQQAAAQLGYGYVGTEHILIGLIREGTGVAARVLQTEGITEDKIIKSIMALIGMGTTTIDKPDVIPFTPRGKSVIELSLVESRRLGQNYIGTEHVLIGILREGEGVAVRVLAELNANPQRIYEGILSALDEEKADFFRANSQASGRMGERQNRKSTGTPTLDRFGRDLTALAKEGKIDPVVGRDKEIERVVQILSRRTKNNPCLIGEPGVGKTAIVEGLAEKIIEGNIPEILRNKRVFTLDISSMVAGSKYRGEFEDRFKKTLEEVRQSGNVVMFIDEMHTIVGAGAAEGAIDAANILKPSLARGEIQIIGATTLNEYRKHIEKDTALERRFQTIIVGEPSKEEAYQILKGLRDKYEAHHKVKITDEALKAAVDLSTRYITDRYLPDKAIDLIDEAAAKIRMKSITVPPDVKKVEEKLKALDMEKEEAIRVQDFEKASYIRDQQTKIKKEFEGLTEKWQHSSDTQIQKVSKEAISEIVSGWTGVPVRQINKTEKERLLNLEQELHKRIIGQDEAVNAVAKAIRRGRSGLKDPKRPIGSFMFLGPTGVGKTELCKALAEVMFEDESSIIRVDMSEYMEKFNVAKLVGAPPGYVGYEEGGQLTEKVRRKPYSVILLDEIEKAHPETFNILLQILEDGRLTDAQGRTVDFRNTVIIMTSNVGARLITEKKKLGFGESNKQNEEKEDYEEIKRNVMGELKRTFRPEFINRVDETIVFHQLNEANLKAIVDVMLKQLQNRLKDKNITINVSEEAKKLLVKEGFDQSFGARPLRRKIQDLIEDGLVEEMLEDKVKRGDKLNVIVENDKIKFETCI